MTVGRDAEFGRRRKVFVATFSFASLFSVLTRVWEPRFGTCTAWSKRCASPGKHCGKLGKTRPTRERLREHFGQYSLAWNGLGKHYGDHPSVRVSRVADKKCGSIREPLGNSFWACFSNSEHVLTRFAISNARLGTRLLVPLMSDLGDDGFSSVGGMSRTCKDSWRLVGEYVA